MRSVFVDYVRAVVRYIALMSVRSGLLYSFLLHLLVLGVALSDLSFMQSRTPTLTVPISIELVTIAQRTNLPQPKVKPKPKPKLRREIAKKRPELEPPKQSAKLEDAVPLPAPPKTKPAKKAEIAKVKPRPKPAPPEKKKKSKIDFGRIAALIDKEKEKRDQVVPEEPEIKDAPASRISRLRDEPLTVSERDAIQSQIQRCWSLPAGAAGAEGLVVKVRVYLRPNGSLLRPPEMVEADKKRASQPGQEYFRTAAESAVRAVQKCEPFRMPSTKYERWREMVLTFDPSEMLGG